MHCHKPQALSEKSVLQYPDAAIAAKKRCHKKHSKKSKKSRKDDSDSDSALTLIAMSH
ncbi:Hypothetical predicted protein [Podarcis lilfordi]|uniref:Uncharacterized protein n=1 Tax=Podarcis lilfordi TaxID=74358 RepID=A0AA35LEY3_9SAUR|nr:Hypothetical predicted protein [Podarcis lilfordi]